MFLFTIHVLISYLSYNCEAQANAVVKRSVQKFDFDLTGCSSLEKQCDQFSSHLDVLTCAIKTVRSNKTQISLPCQHRVWTKQAEVLDSSIISYKLQEPCRDEPTILDCLNPSAYNIDCILKKKPSIQDRICKQAVHQIELIIFNDWQIINNFLKYCMDDIQAYTCGRVPTDIKSLSQKDTVLCLQMKQDNLRPECQKEVAKLQQVKYTSLQLDKVVFAACSIEQKSFCSDEINGSWLMYKCLLRHKYESSMSKRCQDQLFYDQRLVVQNYKMSKGLVRSCKDDIKKYHCRKGVVEDKDVRLAKILLCLENIGRNETTKLTPECTAEMIDHRKMLMDDYRLSPEVMQYCANDITILCKGIAAGGKTIHCLMDHARPRRRKERISMICQRALESLVESADPGEDWRVDPILRRACKPVVDTACREVTGGNGRVMSCLMEALGTALMTADCETALLQIQFFISRDFRLDPQLFKACKYDAVTQCKARMQWADVNENTERDPLVFPCLYKLAYNAENRGKLKPVCEQQIRRVMRQRAVSVDLLPEIEDFCIEDLANLCFEKTGRGQETLCLQDKLSELSPKCKEAVSNFTEAQSAHIELNPVVNINCHYFIDKYCNAKFRGKVGEDDVLQCLIEHKGEPDVRDSLNCRAAIEHEQLILLKNYRFTRKFKNACKSHVVRFCPAAQTKSQVVACLSEIVRNDTLTKKKHTIFKDCRQQLRSQLLQQRETIDLDPELRDACKKEWQTHCSAAKAADALECLQALDTSKFGDACRKALFVVKKQEFFDNSVDYSLMRWCGSMIKLYCNGDSSNVLNCLKAHKQERGFDRGCKVTLVNRLREQNTDYRLNTNLQSACEEDIAKYCKDVLTHEPQDVELAGKMQSCLKSKFRESRLTASCEGALAAVLRDQALDYSLDPLLGRLCRAEIQTICAKSDDDNNNDGQVEECLKAALLSHKIVSAECAREVVHIIQETRVDIEADPLLERACALDLLKYCKELDHGAGRRLKCLNIILNDNNRQLEPECHTELSNRLEMYRYVASGHAIDGLGDVYNEITMSPARKYILVTVLSIFGIIFIFGLYCGRVTKKAMYIKRK